MGLTIPLTPAQIEAAARLHDCLQQWRVSDAALRRLHEQLPGFDAEASLLKAVSINQLYGTQVFAITRMAEHITAIFKDSLGGKDLSLVGRISELPEHAGAKKRRFVSFAAKFCHFFVDQERFPIYDEAAREVLRLHLSASDHCANASDPYRAFCANFQKLRQLSGITSATRELDRYLWLTGMYLKWTRQRDRTTIQVNAELQRLFKAPGDVATRQLETMLPAHLPRVFGP